MDIRNNIKSLREQKGVSQYEMADRMNLDQSSYSRLEKRGNKLSIEQIQSIADALEVDLNSALGYEEPKPDVSTAQLSELQIKNENLLSEIRSLKSGISDKEQLLQYGAQKTMTYESFIINLYESILLDFMFNNKIGSLMIKNGETENIEKEIKVSGFATNIDLQREYRSLYLTLAYNSMILLSLSDEEEIVVFNGEMLQQTFEGRLLFEILENELCKAKYPKMTERFKRMNGALAQRIRIESLKIKYGSS